MNHDYAFAPQRSSGDVLPDHTAHIAALQYITGCTSSQLTFYYQLLDRMRMDCVSYLERQPYCGARHLWGGTPSEHIVIMKNMYDVLAQIAPIAWLTPDEMEALASRM